MRALRAEEKKRSIKTITRRAEERSDPEANDMEPLPGFVFFRANDMEPLRGSASSVLTIWNTYGFGSFRANDMERLRGSSSSVLTIWNAYGVRALPANDMETLRGSPLN